MKYRVKHSTKYSYGEPVSLSHNIVRLRPRDHEQQTCLRHELKIGPLPTTRAVNRDYFGNYTDFFTLQESHRELTISAESEVDVQAPPVIDLSKSPSWEQSRATLIESPDLATLAAREFSFDSPYVIHSHDLVSYALPSFAEGRPLLECVADLTERIHHDFEFLPGSTRIGTPVLEVLRRKRGVCQDFAHLEIGCLRSLGLAARYVSGYLVTTPPPGEERLVGADVSHAWVGVFAPGIGWVDFDPTNGIMPSDAHITVAWARDYDDIGPIRGVLVGGRRQRLQVSVDVVPMEARS